MKKRTLTALLLAGLLPSVITACSSGKSSGSSSAQSTSSTSSTAAGGTDTAAAGLARAKQYVANLSTEPTKIADLAPLPQVPKTGLKAAFLTCPLPSCAPLNAGFTAAAKALGWSPIIITYNVASPGQAVQQAISAGADLVASTSIDISTITPQLAELKAKKIPFFGSYTFDQVEGATNGLYSQLQSTQSANVDGKLGGAWMTADSGGKAHVAFVRLPIYPGTVAQGDAVKSELTADCPNCTYSNIDLSVDELTKGQGASTIVAYLQTHPSVNYLETAFANPLDIGLASAIKTAGLSDKVKILSGLSDTAQMTEVANGTEAAAIALPNDYVEWTQIDAMARQSLGVLNQAAQDATAAGFAFVTDTPGGAKAQIAENNGVWPGPENYESQFKALWKVS